MKRLWIGVGFLAVMLAAGIWLTLFFADIHKPLSDSLQQAAQYAKTGQWEQADNLTRQAREDWTRYRNLIAAVADHEPLEEMESLLEQLELYGQSRDSVEYAALCARIAALADAMGESQQLTWWNLL